MNSVPIPIVLCLSGHDATGGAGIQADIETLFALGCHPCTVITALTEQDTSDVRRILPQQPADFLAQAFTLIDDLPPAAVKIGLLGTPAIAASTAQIIDRLPGVPVVLDPILAAGGGYELGSEDLVAVLREQLIPRTTVLTPNTHEALRLAGESGLQDCAVQLLALGCEAVLLTGTHDESAEVVNRLYRVSDVRSFCWPRLPETYHGSGCTVAAAIAGFLALGLSVEHAVQRAQEVTWASLRAGRRLGKGQSMPDRRAVSEFALRHASAGVAATIGTERCGDEDSSGTPA